MRGVVLALACASLVLACGEPAVDEPANFAPVHYAELDQVSINDRCPVRRDPLNERVEPVYVNGRPLGFC
jgi:hypothetical protein